MARSNLIGEGHSSDAIDVVGNTVTDCLKDFLPSNTVEVSKDVFVTLHRYENRARAEHYGREITRLATDLKHLNFRVLSHPNVTHATLRDNLGRRVNINLESSMDHGPFLKAAATAVAWMTDSGGMIEEATTLEIPLVILREETERPEALERKASLLWREATSLMHVREFLQKASEACGENRILFPFPNTTFGDGQVGNRVLQRLKERGLR